MHRDHVDRPASPQSGAGQLPSVEGWTDRMIKTLGAEYAKRNVTAIASAPGFIATPMTDALNDKQREAILFKVPAARLGTPEDIAAAAVYLSSNKRPMSPGRQFTSMVNAMI